MREQIILETSMVKTFAIYFADIELYLKRKL